MRSTRFFAGSLVLSAVVLVAAGCETSSMSLKDTSIQYACPVCDTNYVTEGDWVQHVQVRHPEADGAAIAKVEVDHDRLMFKYACPVCDMGYMSEAEWRIYMAQHQGEKNIMRPKVRIMKEEQTAQGTLKSYACPVCDTQFVTEEQWKQSGKQ